MPFCGNCGHPLKETDFTCPICGAAQPNAAIPEPDAIPVPEEEMISEIPTTEPTSEAATTSTEEPSASTSYIPPVPPEQSAYNEATSYDNPIPNEIPPQYTNMEQTHSAAQNSYDSNSSYQQTQTNYNTIPPTYQGTSYNSSYSPLSNQSNGFGVASLVLGICSIAICCCYGFGLIPAIIGLILGIVQNKKYSNGIAISGIVLCIIGILLNAVWLIYMILILSASGSGVWNEFFEEFSDEFSENYDYYNNSTL